jgi:hypothetical protein
MYEVSRNKGKYINSTQVAPIAVKNNSTLKDIQEGQLRQVFVIATVDTRKSIWKERIVKELTVGEQGSGFALAWFVIDVG